MRPDMTPALANRRGWLFGAFASAVAGPPAGARSAGRPHAEPLPMPPPPPDPGPSLLTIPIELAGDWSGMIPQSVGRVVERMRAAGLDGVRLVSDRQPARLRVDEHHSGPPSIWLHPDPRTTAWVIVDVGQRAWCQLAYQFGHELGHVLANSWRADARPGGPCQWLEEALVEAFSLRGLGRLAETWQTAPPFPGDNAYADAIARYRADILGAYRAIGKAEGGTGDLARWYARSQREIEGEGGLGDFAKAASAVLLDLYAAEPACLEALGALNRWPERTRLPLAAYLSAWKASCRELGALPDLPERLAARLL